MKSIKNIKKNLFDDVREVDDLDLKYRNMYLFPIFGGGRGRLLIRIGRELSFDSRLWIATVNPEFVMEARKDLKFAEILNKTWLNVPDGVGIAWAKGVFSSKKNKILMAIKIGWEILLGGHRQNLIPGVELMESLCQMAEKENKTVYFLGGWGDRSKKTADFFVRKYPKLKVVGFTDENFDFETKVDMLFVAYGFKKQEEWIYRNFNWLNVGLVMGVGRSFDYFSGELARAPFWLRKMGLEWLYSLFRQPSRWKRQLQLINFVKMVLKNHPEA